MVKIIPLAPFETKPHRCIANKDNVKKKSVLSMMDEDYDYLLKLEHKTGKKLVKKLDSPPKDKMIRSERVKKKNV